MILEKLFTKAWEEESVPAEWLVGIIVKLQKKGNLKLCDNWCGVTLLNVAMKMLTRGIFNRIQDPIERILEVRGKSCRDQIFVLRKMFKEAQEGKGSLL